MKCRFAFRMCAVAICVAIGLCLWLSGASSALGNAIHAQPTAMASCHDSISDERSIMVIDNGDHTMTIKCGDTTLNNCREVNLLEGTDRYVAYADKDFHTFIFDTVDHVSYPVECECEFISFIKDLPDGPLFSYGGGIFRLDGKEITIADYGQADEYSSRNSDCLYISTPIGIGKIDYDKLQFGTQLYMDPKERVYIDHFIETLGTAFNNQSSSIQISLPIIHDNPLLRLNMLYWMSENIYAELTVYNDDFKGLPYGEMHAFLPSINSTEEEMANYYAYMILQGFREVDSDDEEEELFSQFWGGGFVAMVEPLFENDEYVTLSGGVDSNFGGGTGFGACLIPIATFDKDSGIRITIKDIIKEDCLHDFANYLRKHIEDKWNCPSEEFDDDTILSFPIGILQDGLCLIASRHTIVGIGAEMKISFSEIADWMEDNPISEIVDVEHPVFFREVLSRKWSPTLNDEDIAEVDFEVDESDENEDYSLDEKISPRAIQRYYEVIDSLVSIHEPFRDYPDVSCITLSMVNGGYNSSLARKQRESKDYAGAHETYKILYEKFGHNNPMGYISSSYKGLLSSGIRLAAQLIADNKLGAVTEILENLRKWNKNDGYYGDDITDDYLLPIADFDILESRLHARSERMDSAVVHTQKAFPALQNHLSKTLMNISNKERGEVWNHYSKWCMDFLPTLAALSGDSLLKAYSYESLLSGKGLLLNTDIAVRKSILNGSDDTAKRLLLSIDSLSAKLMRLQSNSKRGDEESDKKEIIEKIKSEIERINAELSHRSNYYGRNMERREVTMEEVAASLGDNETAIEFVASDCDDFYMPPSYLALVLQKDSKFPEIIVLGERNSIDSLAYGANVYESKELYSKIWDPIMPMIENSSCVYFSPDGALYTTAIEYLPYNDDGDAVSDVVAMKRLSSTRMIPLLKDEKTYEEYRRHGVGILYGGIDYDNVENVGSLTDSETTNRYNKSVDDMDRAHLDSEFRTSLSNFISRARVRPLKGTKEEVDNIKPFALNLEFLDDVEVISGTEASEESFKNLPKKQPSLLHIATHGFYFTEEELASIRSRGLVNSITASEKDFDDIGLLRSGLIMAGANNTIQKNSVPTGFDDGILTAKEISMVNLMDIDLATLSACQTGLGEIDSDGVMGLQRGFKKAGVNSLVMSLWKVDDEATKILMTEFYRQLSLTGEKSSSFALARRYLRSYDNGIYDHPRYWAAFILLDAL